MADNLLIPWSGRRITLSTGVIAAGAKVYVYLEDTTTLASIYSDRDLTVPLANPVTCDSGGLVPQIYIGVVPYKIRIETSAGVLIDEQDDLPGALDTSPFSASTFAKPDTDIASISGDTSMAAGDAGTIKNINPTGTTIQYTLLSSVTVTNGRGITLRHTGTSGQVKIVTSSSQTITSPKTGVTTTAFVLVGYGESVTLTADGAGWHVTGYVPPFMTPNTPGIITITDRVSASPSSPTPGARYIVSAGFSTFETHDIIEADGQGGFIEYTPTTDCGWLAYVQDEDDYYQFIGSAWVAETATQSDMETATSTTKRVAPGRQHFHPGHPKATLNFDGTGTLAIQESHGIASVVDDGTGNYTPTLSTAFAATTYMPIGFHRFNNTANSSGFCIMNSADAKTTTTCEIRTYNSAAAPTDCAEVDMNFLGDR